MACHCRNNSHTAATTVAASVNAGESKRLFAGDGRRVRLLVADRGNFNASGGGGIEVWAGTPDSGVFLGLVSSSDHVVAVDRSDVGIVLCAEVWVRNASMFSASLVATSYFIEGREYV